MFNFKSLNNKQVSVKNARSKSSQFIHILLSKIVLLLLVIGYIQPSVAQEILEVEEFASKLEVQKADELKSYLQDVHTTIYLKTNEAKTFGTGLPTCLNSDAHSLKLLSASNSEYNSIEFLEIRLSKKGEENNVLLEASILINFPKLKYILIKSEFELEKQNFEKMFSGFNNNEVDILYQVSIPE